MSILDFQTEARTRLAEALSLDAQGVTNDEGRSSLDFLITEIQSLDPDDRRQWTDIAIEIVSAEEQRSGSWWKSLEGFLVLTRLCNAEIGNALEKLLVKKQLVEPAGRASLYTLLDACGKAPSAAIISSDEEVKLSARLRWLDLIIARLSHAPDAQELVLEAAREGQFGLEQFAQRLNQMRAVGGPSLGNWLQKFRSTLTPEDQEHFDQIVDRAFGQFASIRPTSEPETPSELISIRELILANPRFANLPLDLVAKQLRSRSGHRATQIGAKAHTALLQKAMSYNSSTLIQYMFLSAQHHKTMKQVFQEKALPDIHRLHDVTTNLLMFLNTKFYEATHQNFDFLHSYFKLTRKSAPRICLKGNFPVDSVDGVVSIFRDQPVHYESDVRISQNTGFQSIKETGRFFFENNIPEAALAGRYVNPRLDTGRIRTQFKSITRQNVKRLSERWHEFWREYLPSSSEYGSFYKSTMIFPLTLWSNEISEEFVRTAKIPNVENSIFGYLCFDHQDTNYFDDSDDSFVAKIFSDTLCTYVFIRMTYTELSATYKEILALLNKNDMPPQMHKIDQISGVRLGTQTDNVFDPPSSLPSGPAPQLVNADDALVELGRSQAGADTGKLVDAY